MLPEQLKGARIKDNTLKSTHNQMHSKAKKSGDKDDKDVLLANLKSRYKGLKTLEKDVKAQPKRKTDYLKNPASWCFTFAVNLVAFFAFSFEIFSQPYTQHYFASQFLQSQFNSPFQSDGTQF